MTALYNENAVAKHTHRVTITTDKGVYIHTLRADSEGHARIVMETFYEQRGHMNITSRTEKLTSETLICN